MLETIFFALFLVPSTRKELHAGLLITGDKCRKDKQKSLHVLTQNSNIKTPNILLVATDDNDFYLRKSKF